MGKFLFIFFWLQILAAQTLPNKLEIQKEDFFEYIDKWNTSYNDIESPTDELFEKSASDSSHILPDITVCLQSYNFMDCVKMFVLSRVKIVVDQMEGNNSTGVDFKFLNGLVNFKWKHDSAPQPELRSDTLNEEFNYYVLKLFRSRSLQVSVLPGVGIEFSPRISASRELCFSARLIKDTPTYPSGAVQEMRTQVEDDKEKKKKKKKGGFDMMPMMIVPQMIMLGMLPFALANLKTMVMNAFMINSMALNSAIFMTIRNLIFGPRKGPKVKYVNYGYKKKPISKKPELIVHSPAAFVKKPVIKHPPYKPPDPNALDNPHTYHQIGLMYNRRTQKPKISEVPQVKPTYTPDKVNSLYQTNYDEDSNVDAPISYLNNNQYLQQSESIHIEPSYSYDLPESTQGYDAFDNIYLENSGNSRIDLRNRISSKYKNNPSGFSPSLSNHRLSIK